MPGSEIIEPTTAGASASSSSVKASVETAPDRSLRGGARSGDLLKIVASLENELTDTKKLLAEAAVEKQALEKERLDLQRLVEELTNASPDASVGGGTAVNDRARATILQLRLGRIEQKRNQFIDYVKIEAQKANLATRGVRNSLRDLRREVSEQMDRVQELLVGSTADVEAIVKEQEERRRHVFAGVDNSRSENVSSNNASDEEAQPGYLTSMVAAAVQHQQKSMVLAADHPLLVRLSTLYGAADRLVEFLNLSWRDMVCFVGGRPPDLARPRRYIDATINAQNYAHLFERALTLLRIVHKASKLHNDLRLPVAMRYNHTLMQTENRQLAEKVEAFFNAMRVVRTPVAIKERNLGTAFRVLASVAEIRYEAGRIAEQYRKLCKLHVSRMLRYMAVLVRYGRTPAAEYGVSEDVGSNVAVGTCNTCQASVYCEDCFRIRASPHVAQRFALEKHRRSVTKFALQRVEHFDKLRKLVDEAIQLLEKNRLVPVNPAAAVKAVNQIIRKPQLPSSINYFTKLRLTEKNRERLWRGETPTKDEAALAVRPPTLDEQQEALQAMAAEAQLKLLPLLLSNAHEEEDHGIPRRVNRPSPRTSQDPYHANTPRTNTADVGFTLLQSHLPMLCGPREEEAALRHQQRLDAVRRHHVRTSQSARRQHGFSTTRSPRTLSEKILGPYPPSSLPSSSRWGAAGDL